MHELDAQTAALLARLSELSGGVRVDMRDLPIEAVREASRSTWLALAGPDEADCETRALEIPRRGGAIAARLYRPAGARPQLPVVVYFHGGGWVMGDLDSYEPLVKALCQASGCAFVSVDYRLAPEHPFPAGLEDAARAVEWVMEHGAAIGCRSDSVAVMGDSAGGNLAAVVAWMNGRSHPGRIRAQFLIYPMLDVATPHREYPSRRAFGAGDYLLASSDIDAVTQWYLNASVVPDDPRVSPLFADNPGAFPETVIVSAGFDPLTSEANRFAERLRDHGVRCETRCFDHTIHAFMSFGDLDVAAEARAWLAERVRNLLERRAE